VGLGLRIEAIQVGRFNSSHRACRRFGTGVRPGKKPFLPSDADKAQGALGWIVVDGHATVRQERAEGVLAAEPIMKGPSQITFAGDQGELSFRSIEDGRDLQSTVLRACCKADRAGRPVISRAMS